MCFHYLLVHRTVTTWRMAQKSLNFELGTTVKGHIYFTWSSTAHSRTCRERSPTPTLMNVLIFESRKLSSNPVQNTLSMLTSSVNSIKKVESNKYKWVVKYYWLFIKTNEITNINNDVILILKITSILKKLWDLQRSKFQLIPNLKEFRLWNLF